LSRSERTHDPLAELRFGDQEGAQPLGRNVERADRLAGEAVDQRRTAGKLRQLPDHRARSGAVKRPAAVLLIIADEIDRSGQDHEQAVAPLADLEQRLPGIVTPVFAEPAHPLEFDRRQREKDLVAPRFGD
jgi:hypothetical protein